MHAALLIGLAALAGSSPPVSNNTDNVAAVPLSATPSGRAAGAGAGGILDLDTVMVTGVQPGPGMWKVSRGGHVMWVLGLVSPLPVAMTWQSSEVEAVIERAGQILETPMWAVHSDVGFFKGLSLLPAALRARRNPDGAELVDVLPAGLHARWEVQRDKYLGWELGIEHWRPMFAAEKLERKAMAQLGLDGGVVGPVIAAAAARAGLEPTPVQVKTTIDAPREMLEAFNHASFDDTVCLERTVARLEHELPTLAARANAWASGDLETLRRLPSGSLRWTCLQSVLQSDLARGLGYDDLPMQIELAWLEAAEQALADHAVTFALLPMDQVLAADGYLAALRARGYTVEAPASDGAEKLPAAQPGGSPPVPGAGTRD